MRQTKMAFNNIERKWYLVDAKDLVLGRMSAEIASILRGKHKASFTPHEDHGDYIIVINAKQVRLTGNKLNNKKYYNHSGYPGGLRTRNAKTMMDKYPTELVYRSIWGMLPHNALGRKQVKKLFVYSDDVHGHNAQKPEKLELKIK